MKILILGAGKMGSFFTDLLSFEHSEAYFKEFLAENISNLKAEYFIPLMVNKLVNEGTARVKVLDTTSKWFGVTYAADRQGVVDKIQALVDAGEYPDKLF